MESKFDPEAKVSISGTLLFHDAKGEVVGEIEIKSEVKQEVEGNEDGQLRE